MKSVLILKTGTANPQVTAHAGDYDEWFVRRLARAGLRFHVVPVFLSEEPPRAKDYDAILMTGSPASVTEPAPWMLRAGEFMLTAAENGVPVLGVCFGHQLLAHLLGAPVRRNPKGREIGTISCTLTEAGRRDPLFEGIPAEFEVQATHEDLVSEPSPRFELLAGNANTAIQSFRSGSRIRGVQFHPEVDVDTMRALIEARTAKLEAEAAANGLDPKERMRELYAGLRATPSGLRILENFLRHFT